MFNRDGTDADFIRNDPFGWELRVVWIYACNNIVPNLLIQLNIGGCVIGFLNYVFHLVI